MKMKQLIGIGMGLFFCGLGGNAVAVPINISDFSGSETVFDFEGLGSPGDSLTDIGGVNFMLGTGVGVGYTNYSDTSSYIDNATGLDSSGPYSTSMIITWDDMIDRVGFESRSNAGDDLVLQFTTLFNGVVVETETVSFGTSEWGWSGFETAYAFDQLVIDAENNVNGYFRIDNLRYENSNPNAVPEPTTMLLFGTGLLGLVGYNRKRFSKKN